MGNLDSDPMGAACCGSGAQQEQGAHPENPPPKTPVFVVPAARGRPKPEPGPPPVVCVDGTEEGAAVPHPQRRGSLQVSEWAQTHGRLHYTVDDLIQISPLISDEKLSLPKLASGHLSLPPPPREPSGQLVLSRAHSTRHLDQMIEAPPGERIGSLVGGLVGNGIVGGLVGAVHGLPTTPNSRAIHSASREAEAEPASLASLPSAAPGELPGSPKPTEAAWSAKHMQPGALLCIDGTTTLEIPDHNYSMECAFVSQTGYYPEKKAHRNQDCYTLHRALNGNPNVHMLSIFDGHGPYGTEVAQFARDNIRDLMEREGPITPDNVEGLFRSAMFDLSDMIKQSEINDKISGTTAVSILVHYRTLYVSNLGDSRAVVASRADDGTSALTACDLSEDQTPYRLDERQRVKAKGKAKVCSANQMYEDRPMCEDAWEDDWDGADPPRVWFAFPANPTNWVGGTAFTRSIGDYLAHKHGGVISEPEFQKRSVSNQDRLLLIASDGVFEFLDSQACVDILAQHANPMDGCHALVDQSFKYWLDNDTRTDDISAIVVRLDGLREMIKT